MRNSGGWCGVGTGVEKVGGCGIGGGVGCVGVE